MNEPRHTDPPPTQDRRAALLQLTEQLSAALDVGDIAHLVATSAVEALGAAAGFVALATEDEQALEMHAHVHAGRDDPPRLCRLDGSASLPVIDAWRDGRAVLVSTADELYRRWPALDRTRRDRAALAALPLDTDGERFGAVCITWATEQQFDAEQQALLRALASLCAQALRRAHLAYELERMRLDVSATASHELRTPLTAILGAATTLTEPLELSDSTRVELSRLIVAEARRMRAVLEDLQVTAALVERGIDIELTHVDVAEVLHGTVSSWEQGDDASPAIRIDIADDATRVLADATRLRQVVMNLVDNACKYGPSDGTIELLARRGDDGLVRIEVVDEGPGMGSRARARAFDRFWRGGSVDRNGAAGAGLGLHVVRLLTEAMGGRVGLEVARPGRERAGTRAIVELSSVEQPPVVLPSKAVVSA